MKIDKIKRYDVIGDALIWEESDGQYVEYVDHVFSLDRIKILEDKLTEALNCLKPFSGKDGYEKVNEVLAELGPI